MSRSGARPNRSITRSPSRGIKLQRVVRQRIRFLSVEELHRLADAMPVRYRALVFLGGAAGLRWSEAAGLRLSRIDFFRGTLVVDHSVTEVDTFDGNQSHRSAR